MISEKSIVSVPFYNEAKYLEKTLSCLKKVPKDTPVKFFLCNNLSDDGSMDIAEKFVESDDRFILHTHDENIGAFQNFQFSFEKADCDYFMWLGAHDLVDPGYIVDAIKKFSEHETISYAAAQPHAFRHDISDNQLMAEGKYDGFHENRLTRYMQSVAQVSNCTIVNSMFRKSYTHDYTFKHVISWDHIFISHLLWYGPVHYVKGRKYYRRFFKNTQTREEKLLGRQKNAQKKKKLPLSDFLDFYIEDFLSLYKGPQYPKMHLCNKMLDIMEKRLDISDFDYPDGDE